MNDDQSKTQLKAWMQNYVEASGQIFELTRQGSLNDLLDFLAKSAQLALNADLIKIYPYRQSDNGFILPSAKSGERIEPEATEEQALWTDLLHRIAEKRITFYSQDAGVTPSDLMPDSVAERVAPLWEHFLLQEKIASSAFVSMFADDEVVGVLFAGYRTPQAFLPERRELVELIVSQTAMAIRNARIYKESLQRAERLELVRQVAVTVSSTLDLQKILQLTVNGLARVFDVKQTAVALIDESGEYSDVQAEYLEAGCVSVMTDRIPIQDNPQVEKVIKTKQPLIVYDVQNDPIMSTLRDMMRRRRTLSMMVVPIIIDNKVVGTIGIDEVTQKRQFTDDEAKLAQAIADQVAIAIRNAQLIAQVTMRAEALKSLHEVGVGLTSLAGTSEDLREVLDRIATSACTVLGADVIELYQYNESQDEFVLPPVRIGKLLNPQLVKMAVLKDDILYTVIHLEQSKYTSDALQDKILTQQFSIDREDRPEGRFVVREKIRSSAGIPLKVGEEIMGVMFVNFRSSQQFSGSQKEIIELFANQAAIAIRNNRLYNQLQIGNQELNTLHTLLRKLTVETNTDELLREFLLAIHRALRFEYAFVSLVDRYANTIEARHGIWHGEIDVFPEWIRLSKYPLSHKDIMADIVRSGNVEVISKWDERFNKEIWDKFNQDRLIRIFIPIKFQDEVLGAVEAGYDKSHQTTISLEEQQTLQAFVDQAALALHNAGQYQAIEQNLEERLNDIRALQDITEQMHRGDLKAVLSLIAERARELTGAAHSSVWLINKTRTALELGGLSIEDADALSPPDISLAPEGENNFSKLVVLNGKSYLSRDVRKDEAYKPWYPDTISELTVPISYYGRVIGTINVESPYPNRFSEEHKRLVEAMAGQAAVVVQNARLLERLNILDDIGVELTAGIRQEQEIIELLYAALRRLTGAENMYIALYDEGTNEIRFPLAIEDGQPVQIPPRRAEKGMRGKTEEIIFTRSPIFHETKREAEEWYARRSPQGFPGSTMPSWMGVPMQVGEKVLGVIATYHLEEHTYTADDFNALQAIANQAAIVIDNSRLYYEMAQRSAELTRANEELRTLDKRKSDFLSTLSHELRTPLTPVKSCIENMLSEIYGALNEKQRSRLEIALASVDDEARLVDNLLDLVRIQEGRTELHSSRENIGDIIKAVMQILEYDTTQKRIRLESRISPEEIHAFCDRAKVKQVITNLVHNAIKFTESGGTIIVEALVEADKLIIRVTDTGIGIPEKEFERVFDRFYQVDSSLTRKIGGTGIGLNIAKEYVELHGGKIWVESQENSGSVFTFTLPLTGEPYDKR